MKNYLFFVAIFMTCLFMSSSSQAQNFNSSEDLAFVDFTKFEAHNIKFDHKSNLVDSEIERAAKAKAYDSYVSKEFGSYLNPFNGTLNIVNNENTTFTKAQFLNKASDEKLFSIKIDTAIKTMNISNYDSGDYILILSNDKGDILVENFIII